LTKLAYTPQKKQMATFCPTCGFPSPEPCQCLEEHGEQREITCADQPQPSRKFTPPPDMLPPSFLYPESWAIPVAHRFRASGSKCILTDAVQADKDVTASEAQADEMNGIDEIAALPNKTE
jgi:hypothetical protein